VSFLSELSALHPKFVVWKHLDRALRGQGDVDAAAPRSTLSSIQEDAAVMARGTLGASHVIHCGHGATRESQFFVQRQRLPQLFELDISHQPSKAGGPWARPDSMTQLATVRPDGIRSLRPGAEALVSLVLHGISRGGSDRLPPAERSIVNLGLISDLAGALRACDVLTPMGARGALRELIIALSAGEWRAQKAKLAYLAFAANASIHPLFAARRAGFRFALRRKKYCVMYECAQFNGRRVVGGDLDDFISRVSREGHHVENL
jgi:hypothetical protein